MCDRGRKAVFLRCCNLRNIDGAKHGEGLGFADSNAKMPLIKVIIIPKLLRLIFSKQATRIGHETSTESLQNLAKKNAHHTL